MGRVVSNGRGSDGPRAAAVAGMEYSKARWLSLNLRHAISMPSSFGRMRASPQEVPHRDGEGTCSGLKIRWLSMGSAAELLDWLAKGYDISGG